MSKDAIEPKLAELLDSISELEGIVAADTSGKVITGQNITEIDLNSVASKVVALIKGGGELGESSGKGSPNDFQFSFEEGFVQAVWNDKFLLIGLTGEDGRNSLGLVLRSLRQLLPNLK
ncbi:MAG: hypothetical protein ACTSU5_19525 [Promethearchaeota archaeon]